MRFAFYSNEELEKSQKQEVTLALTVVFLCFLWASLGRQTFAIVHLHPFVCCDTCLHTKHLIWTGYIQKSKRILNMPLSWMVTLRMKMEQHLYWSPELSDVTLASRFDLSYILQLPSVKTTSPGFDKQTSTASWQWSMFVSCHVPERLALTHIMTTLARKAHMTLLLYFHTLNRTRWLSGLMPV